MSEPLRVEPRAGERAAAMCEAAADELAECATQLLDPCTDHEWLGACEEGRGWHGLLQEQSVALRSLLDRHVQQLSAFAARFRTAQAAYHDADCGGADRYPS